MSDKIIESISDFLKALEDIKMMEEFYYFNMLGIKTFYRGQANSDWGLSPQLYRKDLLEIEGAMVTRMLHLNPSEFTGSRFDNLTKMQHYGLPTRLLDCTTNPLVALYFACADKTQCDSEGCVFVFPTMPFLWSTNPLIEIYMDLIFEQTCIYGACIEKYLQECASRYSWGEAREVVSSEEYFIRHISQLYIAVQPIYNNSRLVNQAGTFFLFGMDYKIVDETGQKRYNFLPHSSKSVKDFTHRGTKLRIPSSSKQHIIKQLDILSINEERLFPDLAHQATQMIRGNKYG